MSDKINKKFMKMAIAKAKAGIRKGQTPFGACIVKKGRVISCEHNTVWKSCDITSHAEVHAIRKACKKLKNISLEGCTIYSTCEPCPMCFSACHWAKISKIVYGARISDAKKSGFNELNISNKVLKSKGRSRVKIVPDFMRRENAELFMLWQKLNKSKIY